MPLARTVYLKAKVVGASRQEIVSLSKNGSGSKMHTEESQMLCCCGLQRTVWTSTVITPFHLWLVKPIRIRHIDKFPFSFRDKSTRVRSWKASVLVRSITNRDHD